MSRLFRRVLSAGSKNERERNRGSGEPKVREKDERGKNGREKKAVQRGGAKGSWKKGRAKRVAADKARAVGRTAEQRRANTRMEGDKKRAETNGNKRSGDAGKRRANKEPGKAIVRAGGASRAALNHRREKPHIAQATAGRGIDAC